jgi:hypothetical protein
LIDEVIRSYRPSSLAFLPEDPLVVAAAWDGAPVTGGRFKKAVDRWVDLYLVTP